MNKKYDNHSFINIETFDLNLLKALVAIYEERQITAAADRLGITQPGLSHALARLRGTFNDTLFVRHADGMRPTAMAENLYAGIKPGLALLQTGIAPPEKLDPKKMEHTFVLGMNDYGAQMILPGLIRDVSKAAPGVHLKTRHYAHGSQLDDLRQGTIDLSIAVAGEYPGWVNSDLLFEETAMVIVDAKNPILKKGLGLEEYVACPHVIMAPDGLARNWVDEHLDDIGRTRTVQHSVPHFLAIPPIIRGTSMISTLPGRIAKGLSADKGFKIYPLPFSAAAHQIVQLWPRRKDGDPLLGWLRDRIKVSTKMK